MNKLLYILLFMLPISANSQITGFKVLVDQPTSRVSEGKCLVYGNIQDIYGNAVANGSVVTMGYKKRTQTKADGSFSLVVSDKDSAVYFVGVNHQEIRVSYKFRSKHKVKLTITTREYEMEVPEKPVIYLYSDKEKDVSINLKPTNGFLFSYPEYNEGWKVSIDDSGDIIHNGKSYPYLFWEGQKQKIELAKTEETNDLIGFFIKTDTVISFLEDQLEAMGLNRNESTDFITYWGPRLTQKPFAFVQFMEQEAYANNIASIEVNPQPESMQRIFMVFQGISSEEQFKSIPIQPQSFQPFVRKEFTLVEWGGAEINRLLFL